ncbi:hypothetical protein EDF28_3578 [Curtobacterium sp. PhB137]|uniref:hypothetical protein n=1 Tax=Curtobacterium sp. PhB137 TaxID=2485182 RepID=UPI000F5135B0|nr:hypothetical protein [Curtobacterium sp. PhB137]RPE75633.1 hypothetical protein EDF28_3578 [Curtobacterium sp. PhB137]
MISVEGASVLAQVIPVGLLVLAFDARNAESFVGTTPMAKRAVKFARWFSVITVFASVLIITRCVASASSGEALRGLDAVMVYLVSMALWLVVGLTVVVATMTRTGIADEIHERGMKDPKTRERVFRAAQSSYEERQQQERARTAQMVEFMLASGKIQEPRADRAPKEVVALSPRPRPRMRGPRIARPSRANRRKR